MFKHHSICMIYFEQEQDHILGDVLLYITSILVDIYDLFVIYCLLYMLKYAV